MVSDLVELPRPVDNIKERPEIMPIVVGVLTGVLVTGVVQHWECVNSWREWTTHICTHVDSRGQDGALVPVDRAVVEHCQHGILSRLTGGGA